MATRESRGKGGQLVHPLTGSGQKGTAIEVLTWKFLLTSNSGQENREGPFFFYPQGTPLSNR